MTLLLELPAEVAAALCAEAEAQGRTPEEVAAEIIAQALDPDLYALSPEEEKAIAQGLADAAAGRTFSLEESAARVDKLLADAVAWGGIFQRVDPER